VPALLERYAALEKLAPRCAVALNGEYVTAPQLLKDRDELGLIPPLSGG
jgi:molybdopterin converting factor small subunit